MHLSTHLSAKDAILEARRIIKPYIHKTPILTSSLINQKTGCSIYFKCENFQKMGAFKMRGASHVIFSLSDQKRKTGFVTHSSGNHGQAVAKAALIAQMPSYIVIPKNANPNKIAAVKDYKGKVVYCEANEQSRESTARQIQNDTGAYFIHPFNDDKVIDGQATVGAEMVEEIPDLDVIFCPIGGGGLCAGTLLSMRQFSKNTQVVGTEPKNANDAYCSLQKGYRVLGHQKPTVADGLQAQIGPIPFEIIKKNIKEIILVEESEILSAQKFIMERMKIVIEPSSAVAVAGFFKSYSRYQKQKVGIILTGGNVNFKDF